jgi:iron uptake system component EfeO
MFMSLRPIAIAAAALAFPLAIAGCGSTTDASTEGAASTSVAVTASDTACTLGTTSVPAGSTQFAVTNTGDQMTEVYVYGKSGDAFSVVVAEVENIGPGTSRDMTGDLAPGTYEVACKPGQTGDGIRAQLTVTGDAAAATSSTAAAAERQVELTIDGTDQLVGVDGQTATVGEAVQFVVTSSATDKRVFEVKRPDGSVAGEIEILAASEGQLTIDANVAGDWTLIVEGGPTNTEVAFPVS